MGNLFTFLVGNITGAYIAQTYQIPNIKIIFNKFMKDIEKYRKIGDDENKK